MAQAPPPSILAGTLRRFPDFASQCGLRPAALLREAGIDRRVLEAAGARMTLPGAARLLTLAAQRAARPDFGFQLGLLHHPSDLGALGFLWLCAPDAGTAMAAGLRYDAFVQGGSAFGFETGQDSADALAVRYATPGLRAEWRAQDAEFTLAVLLTALRRITGRAVAPLSVTFAHARTAPLAPYRASLGITPAFATGSNVLILPARTLSLPIPTHDPALFAILSDYLERQTDSLREPATLAAAVARHITQSLGREPATLRSIAAALRIAPRSLQRALREEGTSFQAIRSNVRNEVAQTALRETGLAISEIGARAGFADSTAFSRAFRACNGVGPRRWRYGTETERKNVLF